MTYFKLLFLVLLSLSITACGASGEVEEPEEVVVEEPGDGDQGDDESGEEQDDEPEEEEEPVVVTPLTLGNVQGSIVMGEGSQVEITIPYFDASSDILFNLNHELPIYTNYSIGSESVHVTISSSEIEFVSESGTIDFEISDDDDHLSLSIDITVENTSGQELVNEITYLNGLVADALEFPDHQAILLAFIDLAKYSGALSESNITLISDAFYEMIDINKAVCSNCADGFLLEAKTAYENGDIVEGELSLSIDNMVMNMNTLSDNLLKELNKLIVASGYEAYPDSDYIVDGNYGLSGFIGNEVYGVIDSGTFTFTDSYLILNDILGIDGFACEATGEVQ